MPDGKAVEGIAVPAPVGHVMVDEADEAGVVGRLDEVDEFVDDDVFEALRRLFSEVCI